MIRRIVSYLPVVCTATLLALFAYPDEQALGAHKPSHQDTPGNAGNAPGQEGSTPGQSGQSPPGQSGSSPGQSGNPPGQSGNTPGQSGSAPPGQADSAPGRRDDLPLPGDSSPPPDIRFVEPIPSTTSPIVELNPDGVQNRISVHVSPPGDVRHVRAHIGQESIELTPETENTYTLTSVQPQIASDQPFTITADFGSTTASVKGVLRPRVSGATQTHQPPLILRALNAVFRLVHHRTPTYTEWAWWARRIHAREKRSLPDVLGAIQWHNRFGSRSRSP